MSYSSDQLSALTESVMADPAVQQALQAWQQYHAQTGSWSGGHGVSPYEQQLRQAMTAAGMPSDTRISYDGAGGSPHLTNPGLPGWAYPVIGAGIAAGAYLAAPSIFTGAGAHAAGGAAAATTSGAAGTLPATGTIGYGATVPATASPGLFGGGTSAALPLAGGGAGKSALDRVIAAAKPAVAGTAAIGALTHGNDSGGSQQIPPELQQFLDLQRQRTEGQNPLFQAVTQLAYDRMPTNATRGLPPDAIAQAMHALTKGR